MQTYEQFAFGRPLLIAAVARVANANDGTQSEAVFEPSLPALPPSWRWRVAPRDGLLPASLTPLYR